jgi:biopolymer transport protein ExbD
MPLKTSQDDDMPAINLTPMLDIVFNLIIFFMVGTRFVDAEKRVDVQVPQVKNGENMSAVPDKRIVNVYKDGQIALDKREVTLDQLVAQLGSDRRQNPTMAITIRGDGDSAFQHVAAVLAGCRSAGIKDIGISVRANESKNIATRGSKTKKL